MISFERAVEERLHSAMEIGVEIDLGKYSEIPILTRGEVENVVEEKSGWVSALGNRYPMLQADSNSNRNPLYSKRKLGLYYWIKACKCSGIKPKVAISVIERLLEEVEGDMSKVVLPSVITS